MAKRTRQVRASGAELFKRGWALHDQGEKARAFRVFLTAAKQGDRDCQLIVGVFYADGVGVRPNAVKSLYWSRRAYRGTNASAANNIGIWYRDHGQIPRAVRWLRRAIQLGDLDSALILGKIYLKLQPDEELARKYLTMARGGGNNVTQASEEEAVALLKTLERRKPSRKTSRRQS